MYIGRHIEGRVDTQGGRGEEGVYIDILGQKVEAPSTKTSRAPLNSPRNGWLYVCPKYIKKIIPQTCRIRGTLLFLCNCFLSVAI